MRSAWMGALVIAILTGLAATGVSSLMSADRFDHSEHAGLFVSCGSCHSSNDTGALVTTVTDVECALCHDGTREDRVDWTAPERRATNLRFSHPVHEREVSSVGDEAIGCAGCHGTGGEAFMDVAAAQPAGCVDCHAPEAPSHLETSCEACHVPLAEATGVSTVRIAAFERPADHDAPDFVVDHDGLVGAIADPSCAVCHTRESCARCHLDADRRPSILALATDARVAELTADIDGEWPTPASHESPDFLLRHGDDGVASCVTCHAAPSCTSCHRSGTRPWVAELPRPGPEGPRGVETVASRPPGHTSRFVTDHAVAAGASPAACESCHAPVECADCHSAITAGPTASVPRASSDEPIAESPGRTSTEGFRHVEPGYHIDNFVMRHGAEGFGVQATCSDCHSTEAFCRDCHTRSGVGVGRRDGALGAFHDTRGAWLIGHGASARMGLEACASCHQQTSCLRCHSAKAGLRVNPHGPGF
ncbi:MAG: cytochrome c3 family protein, partial [Gemmatimonadota bacterium]